MKNVITIIICLVFFLLPFSYSGHSYTGITLLHLFSLTLVLALFLRAKSENKIIFSFSYFPIFLFFISLILSLFFSQTPSKSLKEFFKVINYLVIYFLILQIFSKEKIDTFFQVIFVGLFLILLYAFHQKFYGYPNISEKLKELGLPSSPTRFSSLFIHPNSLAGYIILIFPPLVGYFILTKNILKKAFYLILIFLSFLSFFFTRSYGGGVCLLFSLFLFFLFSSKNKIKFLKISSLFLLLFFLIISVKKFDFSEKQKSFIGRLYFWDGALNITLNYPKFGAGIDSFSEILPNHQKRGFYSKYAHNNYLQVAAESGLFGLYCFLWMIIFFILFAFHNLKKKLSPDDKLKIISIFAAICGNLLHSFFDFDWNIPAITMLLFAYFAFLQIIPGRVSEVNFNLPSLSRFPLKVLTITLFFFLSTVVVKPYFAYFYFQKGGKKYEEKNYSAARLNLNKALKLNPQDPYYVSKLAEVNFKEENIKEAIALSERAISLQPFSSYFYSQLGTYYYHTRDIQKALSSFRFAAHFYPNAAAYYYILGSIYQEIGDFNQAEGEYYRAIKLKDDYIFAGQSLKDIINSYAALAIIYLAQNKVKEAKEMTEEVLRFEPDHKIKFILKIER